jgi:hypothetical protein
MQVDERLSTRDGRLTKMRYYSLGTPVGESRWIRVSELTRTRRESALRQDQITGRSAGSR